MVIDVGGSLLGMNYSIDDIMDDVEEAPHREAQCFYDMLKTTDNELCTKITLSFRLWLD